jgi:hypothetical protein
MIILLPGIEIPIARSLVIKHPMCFKGNSGTVLIFRNTNITCDFNEDLGEAAWIEFSEVQLIFKIDLRKIGQHLKRNSDGHSQQYS